MLLLPNVRSVVDSSRHALEIVTEEGAKLDLVIARIRTEPGENLRDAIDRGLADQERSLRGFQLLAKTDAEYGGLVGIEVRARFVDKLRGPVFHHTFHTVVESDRVGFFAIASLQHAAACDAWMVTMLLNLKSRV